MTEITIDPLGPLGATDELVTTMVDGFLDDPLYRWMYPPAGRPDHMAETFALMLDAGVANGVVDVARRTGGGAELGVAIWTAEGAPQLDPVRGERFHRMIITAPPARGPMWVRPGTGPRRKTHGKRSAVTALGGVAVRWLQAAVRGFRACPS